MINTYEVNTWVNDEGRVTVCFYKQIWDNGYLVADTLEDPFVFADFDMHNVNDYQVIAYLLDNPDWDNPEALGIQSNVGLTDNQRLFSVISYWSALDEWGTSDMFYDAPGELGKIVKSLPSYEPEVFA